MSHKQYIARENQTLDEHSRNVANLASEFVSSMGETARAVAYVVGWLHDIGKSASKWQSYIKKRIAGEDAHTGYKHSIAGAVCLDREFRDVNPIIRRAILSVILGHHAGLPDYKDDYQRGGVSTGRTVIESIHDPNSDVLEAVRNCAYIVEQIKRDEKLCNMLNTAPDIDQNTYHMWTRLIGSAIVDADHLDAEMAEDNEQAEKRGQGYISTSECLTRYNEWCADNLKLSDTVRGKQRKEIRDACIRSAESNRGIYTLCAPTGSGKTLSSLAFALNHAVRHNKKRIVYVVPYISIIEQTARKFREIFGQDNVIEHHSKYEIKTEVGKDKEAVEDERIRYKQAIENWDAPIIVTTANQFWESCLAARTKRIRKLHNLIDAVVVVDEVQSLPLDAVNAAIGSMQCLSSLARTTFLLMTATMPDYTTYGRNTNSSYLKRLTESDSTAIISTDKARKYFIENPPLHYEWTKPTDTFKTIAEEIVQEGNDVLVITNTRLICRTLYDEVWRQVPETERSGVYHLSNTMCGEHISTVLDEIRKRLEKRRENGADSDVPIRVISTSLVEAGVDIDFPVVYREYIGLDSIIQAAGRCNREGLYERGKVRIFESLYRLTDEEDDVEDGHVIRRSYLSYTLAGIDAMQRCLDGKTVADYDDLFRDPVFISDYYGILLENVPEGVYSDLIKNAKYQVTFRTVGEQFRLIEDESVGILVHYNDTATELIEKLMDESTGSKRDVLRALRRYTVPIFPRSGNFQRMLDTGLIASVSGYDGLWVRGDGLDYDDKTGLDVWLRNI